MSNHPTKCSLDIYLPLSAPKCKPIATKPRRFSLDHRQFIQSEVNRLMSDGVIEFSTSPWRVQVSTSNETNFRGKLPLLNTMLQYYINCTSIL